MPDLERVGDLCDARACTDLQRTRNLVHACARTCLKHAGQLGHVTYGQARFEGGCVLS
jgi:hypothetical protein